MSEYPKNYPRATPGSSIQLVFEAMFKHGCEWQSAWDWTCPVHDDEKASLGIEPGKKYPVVVACQVCKTQMTSGEFIRSFCEAIGIDPKILSYERGDGAPDVVRGVDGVAPGGKQEKRPRVPHPEDNERYVYCDENGHRLFYVDRQPFHYEDTGELGKTFAQGLITGGLVKNLPDEKRYVPYHLPELLRGIQDGKTIFVVAGEKDVLRLEREGHVATTNAGGEGVWKPEFHARWFAGAKQVVVVPDLDAVGFAWAAAVHDSIEGLVGRVLLRASATGGPKHDVSDHLDAGFALNRMRKLDRADLDGPSTEPAPAPPKVVDTAFWDSSGRCLFEKSDVGVARFIVHLYGSEFRYVREKKSWVVWNGKFWEEETDAIRMTQFAEYASACITESASVVEDPEKRGAALAYGLRRNARASLNNAVALVNAEPGVAISASELDTNLMLLPCENGVLDLETGILHPHDVYRDSLITMLAPVQFMGTGKHHPEFDKYLDMISGGDADMLGLLQRAAFESLTGSSKSKCFINLFDSNVGNTGKTQLTQCLLGVLGPYGTTVEAEAFLVKRSANDSIPTEIAQMVSKRFVVSDEMPSGRSLSTGLMKRLTKGGGQLQFRDLYKAAWTAPITFTIWLDGNGLSNANSKDHPLFDRWRMVEFEHAVPEEGRVKDWAGAQLQSPEFRAAVLAWALRGRESWLQLDGIGTTAKIRTQVEIARVEMDETTPMINELFEITGAEADKMMRSEMWDIYGTWFREKHLPGERPLTRNAFFAAIGDRSGVTQVNTMRKNEKRDRGFAGIKKLVKRGYASMS